MADGSGRCAGFLRAAMLGGFGIYATSIAPDAARAAPDDVTPNDVTVDFANTVRLSAKYQFARTYGNAAGYCAPEGTFDTGPLQADCDYGGGFISGRLDWLSEIEIADGTNGLHASARAWYDAVDQRPNGRDWPIPFGKPGTSPAIDPSEEGGRHVELFEAFLHGTLGADGSHPLSFRLGRHTLVWGESLYFTRDGIAAAQTPVDTYRLPVAGQYQGQDSYLPVGQLSFTWQAADDLAIEGYYQFEWRRDRIDPEDAYASATDILGADGNHLIGAVVPGHGLIYYRREADETAGADGQFGLALRSRMGDLDIGLYAARYTARTPIIDFYPPASSQSGAGAYNLEFPGGIELYGVSVSGPIGAASFGAELSARRNMPLVNGGIPLLTAGGDGGLGAHDPLGDTLHAQLSLNYATGPLPGIPAGATWSGEVAANRLLDVSANAIWQTPGRSSTAAALRTVLEPRFLEALPHVDLTIPVGFGWNFLGLSSVDPAMNRGTGDVSIGVTATFDRQWKGAVALTHYFGHSKSAYVVLGATMPAAALSDWDFLGISIERSF